jgi:hypothetical protein
MFHTEVDPIGRSIRRNQWMESLGVIPPHTQRTTRADGLEGIRRTTGPQLGRKTVANRRLLTLSGEWNMDHRCPDESRSGGRPLAVSAPSAHVQRPGATDETTCWQAS